MRLRRINVEDLKPGHYVSRLDRPWSETPLPYRGFEISGQEDLDTLRAHCRHVWISVQRESGTDDTAAVTGAHEPEVEPESRIQPDPDHSDPEEPAKEYPDFRKGARQVKAARKIVADACAAVLNQSRDGQLPDPGKVQPAVNQMQQALEQFPHAGLWLLSLRDHGDALVDHSVNVAALSMMLGRRLRNEAGQPLMSESEIVGLGLAGLFHDLGKTMLPRRLVYKKGPESQDDWDRIHNHPYHGSLILRRGGAPDYIVYTVRHHQERIDGTGFPDGLQGRDIKLPWRIVGLSNAYDSMTSSWPRFPAISGHQALRRLAREPEQSWGRKLVQHFTQMMGVYPPGTPVILDNGTEGIVVESGPHSKLQPVVAVRKQGKRPGHIQLALVDLSVEGNEREIDTVTAPDAEHRRMIQVVTRTAA